MLCNIDAVGYGTYRKYHYHYVSAETHPVDAPIATFSEFRTVSEGILLIDSLFMR